MHNKKAGAGQTARGGVGKYGKRRVQYTTPTAAAQPVYAANGRVVIGHIVGDTFHKTARGSKHMLRKPRGWAIDTPVLTELLALGVASIEVKDTETGIVYTAPLATFERYGVPLNRGFGPQVALPLGYWAVDGNPPRLGQPHKPDSDGPRQLSLFAE